jgi:hydrogenase maturation protease
MVSRILVAGIGNVFFGDDGFGVEVARRLGQSPLPASVRVIDFGIRGLDLAYALLDGCEVAILVDAMQRGCPAGTLFVMEPDLEGLENQAPGWSGHTLDLGETLRLAHVLGGRLPVLRLVGCEPADLGGEEGSMTLSAAVAAAVELACSEVRSLVAEFLAESPKESR